MFEVEVLRLEADVLGAAGARVEQQHAHGGVPAGRTDRHRLNRGDNHRLNPALHYVALTQATWEPRAVAYLARKQAEGKTKREALRCLKRRLSNVVFKALLAGPKPSDLAA